MTAAVFLFAGTLAAQTPLERGKEHYRAGRYVDAIEDLRAAANAALPPEARQAYVATGKLDSVAELEESLLYLALAYDRIGREAEARDAVTRLLNVERIKPTYASLPLANDAAAFEPLAERLVPSIPLTPNPRLKSAGVVVQPTVAQQRADLMNLIEERVAAARAELEKSANERVAAAQREADERVAQARAEAIKRAEERVVAETATAQRAAETRIAAERAAAEKSADERIAAVRAEVEKAAEAKIAEERALIQKLSEERIAVAKAAAEKDAQERISAVEAEKRRALLASLREAETLIIAGQLTEANRIYTSLAQSPASSREAIAAAATGFYRTGAFQEAVRAFGKLGALNRGEDDLRYYYAVSLFETGQFAEARDQLAAALPNLQRTDDVERYRVKIEQQAQAKK
ncbi:MAG TPA: tetratricopeptide repeat protein [Thermoanaerobaculia bacterium]